MMADVKVEVSSIDRAVIVKALVLLSQSRERQASKEVPGSPIYELLRAEIGGIDNLAARFR
jgi:hypothetical protein